MDCRTEAIRVNGSEQPAISLWNVGVQRKGRWILRGVDWSVPRGACAAIIGPNGSGKSTLARILACHLWPTDGQSCILGSRFGDADLPALRQSIRLLQPAGPYDIDPQLSAREVVVTGFFGTLALYDSPSAEQLARAQVALEQVGMGAMAEQAYTTLSSGERVRALIARAMVERPALLLLDEPTAGLDLLAREQVVATVQGLFERPSGSGRPTVVFITHHVEELPPATSQVIALREGRMMAQGTPGQVLTEEVLSRVYGCPVQVRRSGGRTYLEVHPAAWEGLIGNGGR